jgi:hypothetical protein
MIPSHADSQWAIMIARKEMLYWSSKRIRIFGYVFCVRGWGLSNAFAKEESGSVDGVLLPTSYIGSFQARNARSLPILKYRNLVGLDEIEVSLPLHLSHSPPTTAHPRRVPAIELGFEV